MKKGGVEFIIDITDSKQAEGEIRFSKAMLEAQTEASIDGILTVSPERKMISYNQRFVEMWDILEEVLQTRSDEAVVEAVKDKVVDPQAYLKRVSYLYDHPNDDSDEEILLTDGRTFERYSAPVTGPDGSYYGRVWYFRDITRRKRAEESLLEIRAAERRRIARDLHDAVLQDLAGALQGIQALQLELQSAEEQKADLKQESDALRRAVSRLRGAIHDLREEKDQSFIRAIESLVEYTRQLAPECQVKLNVQDDFPQELPEAIKMELLRIVQEALTNARQHSEAQWIGVKLYKPQEGKVCLRVKDDGRGFDSETVHKGLGLLGMQERTEAFGGELEIQSEKGQGTMISVTVPL
jgi:signal transduction histidine kinase